MRKTVQNQHHRGRVLFGENSRHAEDVQPVLIPPGQWTDDLNARLRVLLHADPLLKLKQGDARRDESLQHYDTLVLAVKVFDLIIDNMGLEEEIDRDRLLRELRPLLVRMDGAAEVEPDAARHEAIVDRLLAHLRNDDDSRRPFSIEYLNVNEEPPLRQLGFRLVSDVFHASGGTVLRLSNEAINLFLNALDLDIEDAQAAAEAVVESQLSRGRFDEAAHSARNARMQSVRYQEKIGRILRETRRDVSRMDWHHEIPRLLDEAVEHIDRRLTVEHSIIEVAEERLSALDPDDERVGTVTEVLDLVRQCRLRHAELHLQLMQARNVFLDEQGRQSFTNRGLLQFPDLLQEVVEPLLTAPSRFAGTVAERAYGRFLGAKPPALGSLRDLVCWQLRQRREISQGEVPIEEPDLSTVGAEPLRYPKRLRSEADRLLNEMHTTTRLSSLLQTVQESETAQEIRELLCLISLQQFGRDAGEDEAMTVQRADESLLAVRGFYGDDLNLSRNGTNDGQPA